MSLGRRFVSTGAGDAVCLTESVQVFGADSTYSSNIATYKFDGNANDETENYDGTESGTGSPTYVTGKFGQAISFNNDYQFVNTGITPSILGNSFSLSAWVYFTSNPSAGDYYGIAGAYAAGSGGASAGQPQSWIFYMSDGGELRFFGNLTSGSVNFSGGTITLNQWNFIAFSVDDQNEINVYLNGNQTTQSVSNSLTANTVALCLGNPAPYDSNRGMIGLMDQVRVFNKALNPNDFATLYAETDSTTSNTNLFNEGAAIALWSFDTDATETGGNYTGTPTNVEFGVLGKTVNGARFNGSSSIIALPSSAPFGDNDTIKAVSAWVKLTTTSSKGIVYTVSSSTNLSDYFTMQIRGDLSMVYIAARNGSSSNQYQTITSITLDTNWHHYVFQLGTSSREIYIDGVKQTVTDTNSGSATSTSWISYPSYDNTIHSDIGLGRRSSAYYSDMNLDQVRMFGSALTLTQVSELYNEKPCADTSDFKTVLYYGNGDTTYNTYISNVAIDLETNGGLVWVKALTAYNHLWMDSVRGTTSITSNDTTQARTNYNRFQSYEANGFMILANNAADLYKINRVSNEFVSWVWKGGGDAVSNTNGTITSQVSANAAAGFSICKWTGTGVDGKTIGHGLGAAPELIITKGLSNATSWVVGIGGVSGLSVNDYLTFTTNVKLSSTTFYQAYSTDTFQVGVSSANEMNKSASNDYISYCFRSISGYSKIGTYEGNGNTATTTITTDFEPSWVMIKRTDSANNWVIFDNKRDTTSPLSKILYADLDDSEAEGGTTTSITISSTGFSMSTSQFGGSINADGGQYLYMAFK